MHLTEKALARLIQGDLPREERNEAVRHLLTRCPECVRLAQAVAARRFRRARPGKAGVGIYDRIFKRLEGAHLPLMERFFKERLLAAGQWASLEKHPQAQRLALLAADPSFHTWGLYERLLEAAREAAPAHPGKGLERAHLALAVANELDPQVYGEAPIMDFKAGALAVRGNCKRIAEDFEGARADLEHASQLLEEGTGDPLATANLLSLRGSLSKDLGFYAESERLLQRAIHIYGKLRDEENVGKVMVQQATAVGFLEPERAVEILDTATDYVNSIAHPLLELCLRHQLAVFLNDAGRTQEAIGVLEDSRSLYDQFPDSVYQLRLRWLEGRISRNLGNLEEAEETFERLAEDFLGKGLSQEYLLCRLDLAEAVYAQGDRARTVEICTNLYRALESWHMHSEGLAVMLLFVSAVEEERVEQGAFVDLARYLRQAWYVPQGKAVGVH
ncbi:MAG TPA: hypothetical protein VLQ45_15510 [Thermoanaerobaculia bacterium]|nr:hypothetical protein [Thermoanaerobaculia bacterium]